MNKYVTNLTLPNGTNVLIKDSECRTNLSNEIRRATAKETLLQQNINAEASSREQADQVLQTNIDNEAQAREQADQALQTMLSSPYNFKGDVASISALPASGEVNDTYYVQDVKYKVTWTGSAWVQSSLSEADYQTELSELNGDLEELNGRTKTFNTFGVGDRSVSMFFVIGNTYTIKNNSNLPIGSVKVEKDGEELLLTTVIEANSTIKFVPTKAYTKIKYYENNDCELIVTSAGLPKQFENVISLVENLGKDISNQIKYVENSNYFINLKNITYGKFLDQNVENSNDNYCYTDYIELFNPTYNIFATCDTICDFYDANKSFIIQIAPEANRQISIPKNSKYVRVSLPIDKLHTTYFGTKKVNNSDTIIVNNGESILEGVIQCYEKGFKKVIVEGGTYDIIQEYKNHFGNDCFETYSQTDDYNYQLMGVYGRGIWLKDIEILFRPNTKVIAHYTGTNTAPVWQFSPFATGDNVIIDGLNLDSSNLRYAIHSDYNYATDWSYLKLKNCVLKNVRDNGFQQAFGAGLGVHSDWLIENCVFKSINDSTVFRIHNNASSNAESKIVITNCYVDGEGKIVLNAYSNSTKITEIQASNCSTTTPIEVGLETPESNMNFHLTAWNNEIRSN